MKKVLKILILIGLVISFAILVLLTEHYFDYKIPFIFKVIMGYIIGYSSYYWIKN